MKTELKDILDNFISVRDIRNESIVELQSIGFRIDPNWNIGVSKEDSVLNYNDRIIIVFKDHDVLLVDPIKYESEEVSFIKFALRASLLDDIMYYIRNIT